jgi:hypothetical protein
LICYSSPTCLGSHIYCRNLFGGGHEPFGVAVANGQGHPKFFSFFFFF